jgi:hypothetical protein
LGSSNALAMAGKKQTQTDLGQPYQSKCQRRPWLFFSTFFCYDVGNGASILFWRDNWLHGKNIEQLAPRLYAAVPKRFVNSRMVQEVLNQGSWMSDIKGALTVGVLTDFMMLWDLLLRLNCGRRCRIPLFSDWLLMGSILQNLCMSVFFFFGSVQFEPFDRIWKSWAPGKCKLFMWLAANR